MTHKTTTIETNARERFVFSVATHYGVKCGKTAYRIFDNQQEARQHAESTAVAVNRGAMVYALYEFGHALLATFNCKTLAWKESDQ